MLFNWDTENICVIFSWWHINGIGTMLLACLLTAVFGIIYEAIRNTARRYDARLIQEERRQYQSESESEEEAGVHRTLHGAPEGMIIYFSRNQQIMRSLLYAIQVGIGFMLMLIFMTYNGFLMLAVVFGAGIGHFLFARKSGAERSLSCH
jgi:copper transporter 1